jgi:hypothetical protein
MGRNRDHRCARSEVDDVRTRPRADRAVGRRRRALVGIPRLLLGLECSHLDNHLDHIELLGVPPSSRPLAGWARPRVERRDIPVDGGRKFSRRYRSHSACEVVRGLERGSNVRPLSARTATDNRSLLTEAETASAAAPETYQGPRNRERLNRGRFLLVSSGGSVVDARASIDDHSLEPRYDARLPGAELRRAFFNVKRRNPRHAKT